MIRFAMKKVHTQIWTEASIISQDKNRSRLFRQDLLYDDWAIAGEPKFKSRAVRVNNSLLHTILMRWFYRRTYAITWKGSVDCTQADYMFILQLSTKGYVDDFETNSTFKDRMWKTISWTLSTEESWWYQRRMLVCICKRAGMTKCWR